jgi:2-phospho-L-lactate guanylyltransferase (CobY/MobA/RfbA family)
MATFKLKFPLGKINIRKVGSYANLERILREKGLLAEVVETTSKGSGSTVWVIEKKNDPRQYVAISSYGKQIRSRKDGRKYYFYKYFLVDGEYTKELLKIFQ